jgi:hypothetical protein
MKAYARRGAESRVRELVEELDSIYEAFPDLRSQSGGRRAKGTIKVEETGAAASGVVTRRRRRKMSAAQRKAVGERMRRYWAARRKAQRGEPR